LTQDTIISGSVKCVIASKHMVMNVENWGRKWSRCGSAIEGIQCVGGIRVLWVIPLSNSAHSSSIHISNIVSNGKQR